MDVTEAEGLKIVTPDEGITDHEYDVGELLAAVENDKGAEGFEHTAVAPLMAFITGACEKTPKEHAARNNV